MTSALEDMKPLDITEWLTLDTASSPSKLPMGHTPKAINTWVDEMPGSVVTAPGFRKVGTIPSNNPVTFCIDYFKTSSGTQTFVVSDNATVWTTVDFQNFTSIITGLSSAFQLRGMVIRDKLWLTNGSDAVRTFDGTTVVVLDGSGSTPDVPKGRYISYHDERVWLYHIPSNRSQMAFSTLTDSSGTIIAPDNASAWPSSNTLQISEGDADFGTGLLLYRGYLYMFKQYSIWRLIGYDEYTYSRVKCRASTGTRFNESLQILDNLIHMIGIDGIYVFDGEDTERISDIIDSSAISQAFFGFNTLQQPNSNNEFWEVSDAIDWNAGSVIPPNASIADQSLMMAPADTTQADFQAGVVQTNIDSSTTPDSIQLSRVISGTTGTLLSSGKTGSLRDGDGVPQIGTAIQITDGDFSGYVGFINTSDGNDMAWSIDLGSAQAVGEAIIKQLYIESLNNVGSLAEGAVKIQYSSDNVNWSDAATVTLNAQTTAAKIFQTGSGIVIAAADYTVPFATAIARYWRLTIHANKAYHVITELQIYAAGFQSTGKFVSKPLDYINAPTSFGNFNADIVLNGETATFFTQSSSDGSSWDAEVVCTNGGAIGSAVNRYLRWGVNFSSDSLSTPVLSAVYLASKYESAIHNTGGSIFAWGPYESDYNLAGQTIKFYYRGATTAGGVASASWNLIVPGGVIGFAVTNVYIQFKIEILGGTATTLPVVKSVTINWVVGTGVQAQTLQNVASFFWRNRYWMSAASKGSSSNDTILIRGKKTFKSPWQLKDWPILSFCRFQDGFYGGSSVDGSIYQLDVGNSKDGAAMDSFFETGDFTFMGNHIHCHEVELEVERMGSYNLRFGISIDRGATWIEYDVPLTASTFIPSYWVKVFVDPGTTPYIRFRVRTNGVDQPFQVHNLRAYYEIRTARGSLR